MNRTRLLKIWEDREITIARHKLNPRIFTGITPEDTHVLRQVSRRSGFILEEQYDTFLMEIGKQGFNFCVIGE